MTTVWRFAFILCVTLREFGCTSAPRISEYGDQPYEEVYSAPLVIVGIADSDTRIGGKQPSKRDPSYPMQLHRVRVRIENVLRVTYYAYDLLNPLATVTMPRGGTTQ